MKVNPIITVITPTTGKKSLFKLIKSIWSQGVPVCHIILWDANKSKYFKHRFSVNYFDEYVEEKSMYRNYIPININMKANVVQGNAKGSALRAIGLMAANTDLVTFADDDVEWENNHLLSMLEIIENKNSNWCYCKRKIYCRGRSQLEYLGIDNFESVGEDAKTPYKMVDNNCMMFRRSFGVIGSVMYRETKDYNDDRLMYNFLKENAGDPAKTNMATIKQICPQNLEMFFRTNCTKDTGGSRGN